MKALNIVTSLMLCLLIGQFTGLKAQEVERDKKAKSRFEPSNALLIAPNYTVQFPFGDIKNRFGINSLFGANFSYKIKQNWIVGFEGGFIFGAKVKESYLLDHMSTSLGQHITQNEILTNVLPQEQGFNVKFVWGKIIPFSTEYPDAGLLLQTGVGYLEHRIAYAVKGAELPQLNRDYKRGYDRLSSGPVLSQFVGGIFMKRKSYLSLYGGVQFDIGFTKGRRTYDFYSMAPMRSNRVDMFLGIKVGWIIPIFTRTSEKEYYYY